MAIYDTKAYKKDILQKTLLKTYIDNKNVYKNLTDTHAKYKRGLRTKQLVNTFAHIIDMSYALTHRCCYRRCS